MRLESAVTLCYEPSPRRLAKAAEFQHGDVQHPQQEHECHFWKPGHPQEKCQSEGSHHTGQEGVASAVARLRPHRVVAVALRIYDNGAVGTGALQPGHAAHLPETHRHRFVQTDEQTNGHKLYFGFGEETES